MNIFEPLFLLLVLVTTISLGTAAVLALGGSRARAWRILRRLAIGAVVYFGVVIAVSIVSPRRVYKLGDNQCFDDWCIAVVGARHTLTPSGREYDVSLRLSNRARRMPMGERGTVVYLTDQQNRRFDPLPDPAAIPINKVLQPGESIYTTRRFAVASDALQLGLVYTREGGFPIGWLIISEGGWFQKPPIVRLD